MIWILIGSEHFTSDEISDLLTWIQSVCVNHLLTTCLI